MATLVNRGDVPPQRRRRPGDSSEPLLDLLDALPVLVALIDQTSCVRFANAAAGEWLGSSREEAVGLHLAEALGPQLYAECKPYIEGALAGQPQRFERLVVTDDGSVRHAQTEYLPVVEDGRPAGFYVLDTDITPRVEAESRHLSSVVRTALRAERSRLAVEMQDSVLQQLYAAGLQLMPLTESADGTGPVVEDALAKIQNAMELLRRSMHRLEAGGNASPVQAIRDVAAEAGQWLGFPPVVDHAGCPDDLPEHLAEALLAALTDSLVHVVRHTSPDRVHIAVTADGGWLDLQIRDDGRRPEAAEIERCLATIRHSAELLAGTFTCTDLEPTGTQLRWRVPLPRSQRR
jgi:PAS domain S-box-containing protein